MNVLILEPSEFYQYDWSDLSYTDSSFTSWRYDCKRYCVVEDDKVISFIEVVGCDRWCGYGGKYLYALTSISTKESYRNSGFAKLVIDFTFKQLHNERTIILSSFTEDGENYIKEHVYRVMKKHDIMEACES